MQNVLQQINVLHVFQDMLFQTVPVIISALQVVLHVIQQLVILVKTVFTFPQVFVLDVQALAQVAQTQPAIIVLMILLFQAILVKIVLLDVVLVIVQQNAGLASIITICQMEIVDLVQVDVQIVQEEFV